MAFFLVAATTITDEPILEGKTWIREKVSKKKVLFRRRPIGCLWKDFRSNWSYCDSANSAPSILVQL